MTQWAATIFAWFLIALLILTDHVLWAVIAAGGAVGLILAVVIAGAVTGHVRRQRVHGEAVIPPPPDLEFLGPPGGCEWCTDLDSPGDPRDCRCETACQGIDWCNAGGWTTNLIPVITEERPS